MNFRRAQRGRWIERILAAGVVLSMLTACSTPQATPGSSQGSPAASQQSPGAGADPVKIGVVMPLSGRFARVGTLMTEGYKLAVEDINAQGGIKSLGGAPLKLEIVDGGESPETAQTTAQSLVSGTPDLSALLGAYISSLSLTVSTVTERAHLPMLSNSFADQLTERGFKYIFVSQPRASTLAKQSFPVLLDLAQAASGKRPTRVAIVSDTNESAKAFFKPMLEGGFKEIGLEVATNQIFTPPLADASALVQAVMDSKPDFLYFAIANNPDLTLVLQKLRERRATFAVAAQSAALGLPDAADAIGVDALEGFTSVVANWPGKQVGDLRERYMAFTKEPWMTQEGINGYADVWVLKEALEAAGSRDREKVAEALRALHVTSGPATFHSAGEVDFDDKGRISKERFYIFQWQGGRPIAVYPPEIAEASPRWPSQ